MYPHMNYLTTLSFGRNVLKFCKNKPLFLVDVAMVQRRF